MSQYDIEQLKTLRHLTTYVLGNDYEFFNGGLIAMVSTKHKTSVPYSLDSLQAYNKLLVALRAGYDVDHYQNPIGHISIDDLCLTLLTQVAIDIDLTKVNLYGIFDPVPPNIIVADQEFEGVYNAFWALPFSPMDRLSVEYLAGVQFGYWQTVSMTPDHDPAQEVDYAMITFCVTDLQPITNV